MRGTRNLWQSWPKHDKGDDALRYGCARPEGLHYKSTNSARVVKYAGASVAIAALCLFARWAAATNTSNDGADGKIKARPSVALGGVRAPAVRMARHRCDLPRLAAKRVGYIHVVSVGGGDAVAKMADVIDDQTLNHGARR